MSIFQLDLETANSHFVESSRNRFSRLIANLVGTTYTLFVKGRHRFLFRNQLLSLNPHLLQDIGYEDHEMAPDKTSPSEIIRHPML